jgi:hypothetical protein
MVLAGCNSDSVMEQLPGQAPATTVEDGRSDPATPVQGEPDPAASKSPDSGDGSQVGPEQLEAVLAAVDEAESLNAQVIPHAELRTLEAESARRAEGIVVTPEECDVYAEPSPDPPAADAGRAAMTFAGESSLQPDTVSLSSLPSEETAIAQMQASLNQLERCSGFTMEISGEKIMMTVAEIQVDTAADNDLALRTTAQVPGTIQQTLTVRAVVGSTVVDVLVGSSTDPEADAARAERLVDLVVAELRLL